MLNIRRAKDRFHTDAGWLHSWHTFSFGHHHDPRYVGFRDLLVINDDTVAGGGGFAPHGHSDMEILSYVVDGALGHKDSMGNGSTIRPGDLQRMSAGTGVRHSEMNAAATPTRFLQIWIKPDRPGHPPSYEQKNFSVDDKRDRFRLVASGDGRDGSVSLHNNVELYASLLAAGARVTAAIENSRHGWVQIVRGAVTLNGEALAEGDGAALSDVPAIEIVGVAPQSELLFFHLG